MEQTMPAPNLPLPEKRTNAIQKDIVRLIHHLAIITSAVALLFTIAVATFHIMGLIDIPLSKVVAIVITVPIIAGITHLFAQRGETIMAIRVYAYGLVLALTLTAYAYGGANGPAIAGYFVPILVAGLLGQSSDGIGAGVFAGLCYLVLTISQAFGVKPIVPLGSSSAFTFLAFFLASGGILVFFAWTTKRDLTESLAYAATQTEELLERTNKQATELLDRTHQLEEKNQQQNELGSELSAAASQLQVTSQQQASGATEQASAVSEVSTTVEELGATARQIAQSAEHVAQAAQQTLEHLSNGQSAVDESVQAMERIRARMQDISTRVLSLGERSQQIGEIIDLIDDISDETHLLALNAAIEAAGAGEHGRRFAVVAAEVKSLANRTLAAAKEVKGVIAEIREANNAAVLAAEEGGKEVERGAELAYRAGQVMDTILMVAERTAQSAAEIGMATAQQQSASEQVVDATREIAEVARQSADGARQMAESSAMLTAIADRLNGVAHT